MAQVCCRLAGSGASGSSTVIASWFIAAGALAHARAVRCTSSRGICAPAANAGDVTSSFGASENFDLGGGRRTVSTATAEDGAGEREDRRSRRAKRGTRL